MYHSFDEDIAAEYGIPESIILCNIAFWVEKNTINKHNYFEGRYWTYNSFAAFQKLFKYMSESTIKRTIKRLKEEGLILTGNFNEDRFVQTNYYTLTDKGAKLVFKRTNGECQNDTSTQVELTECIFNNNTPNTDINSTVVNKPSIIPREVAELDSMFEQFWESYPKKVDKKGNRTRFVKIKNLKQLFPTIMQALEIQKRSKQWNEENGRFVPNPSTWINQERWNDVNEVAEKQIAIEETVSDEISGFL